jgi:hypothetical protein
LGKKESAIGAALKMRCSIARIARLAEIIIKGDTETVNSEELTKDSATFVERFMLLNQGIVAKHVKPTHEHTEVE